MRNTELIPLFGLPSWTPCGHGIMLMQLVVGTADTGLIQSDCCFFVIPSLGFALQLASQTATKLVACLVVKCEENFTRANLLVQHIYIIPKYVQRETLFKPMFHTSHSESCIFFIVSRTLIMLHKQNESTSFDFKKQTRSQSQIKETHAVQPEEVCSSMATGH